MAGFRVYFQIFKTQLIRSMTYKFEVYSNIIMQTIMMLASAFFWKALFLNSNSVGGVDVDTMLVYTVVSAMISVILSTNVERRITMSVERGSIAIDMMRPVNVFAVFLFEDIGTMVSLIVQNLIPIFVIGTVFIGLPKPSSGWNFVLFLFSLSLAFWINWLLSSMFGMIAFWAINMDALIQVKKHLVRLLSGSLIPLWFFPDSLRNVLECLPFAYLYQLPLNIYVGHFDTVSLNRGFFIQGMWLVLLTITFFTLQKRVTGKVMIQGG